MRIPFITSRIEREANKQAQIKLAELLRYQVGGPGTLAPMAGLPKTLGQGVVPQVYPTQTQPTYPLYAFDTPILYATPNSPKRRPGSLVDIQTLRTFADTYDVLRSCINHLKREIENVPIKIQSIDTKDDSPATQSRIEEASQFFRMSGGLGGPGRRRNHFESELIEDICIVGAGAIYFKTDLVGRPLEAMAIDAGTIRPRIDAYGWADDGTEFEQWIQGLLIRGFDRTELAYDGIFPVSYSPYFKSQVEWLVAPIISALKADEWNRVWLTDGTTPSDMIALPEDWTVEQIQGFSSWFNELLAGNVRERQRMKFVPSGSQKVSSDSRKDQEFSGYELWLLRRTCSIMGVQPASIGYVGEQYKVSQDASMDQTTQFGAGSLLTWRKANYDDILERQGYGDLECVNVTSEEEDGLARAQRLSLATGGNPWMGENDARKQDGLEPIPGGDLVPAAVVAEQQAQQQSDQLDKTLAAKDSPKAADAGRWERKALKALKEKGTAVVSFESTEFTRLETTVMNQTLGLCKDPQSVKNAFARLLTDEDVKKKSA